MTAIKMPDFKRIDASAARVNAAIEARQSTPVPPDAVILLQASTLTPEAVAWLWTHWLSARTRTCTSMRSWPGIRPKRRYIGPMLSVLPPGI